MIAAIVMANCDKQRASPVPRERLMGMYWSGWC